MTTVIRRFTKLRGYIRVVQANILITEIQEVMTMILITGAGEPVEKWSRLRSRKQIATISEQNFQALGSHSLGIWQLASLHPLLLLPLVLGIWNCPHDLLSFHVVPSAPELCGVVGCVQKRENYHLHHTEKLPLKCPRESFLSISQRWYEINVQHQCARQHQNAY